MTGLVLQSEDNILQLATARDDLAELENELFVRKEEVKGQIRRTVQELIRSINDQEAKLINQVEAFYDTVSVATDRLKVEKTIFRLERAHNFAKQLLRDDTSPISQLVNRSEAKENLEQAQRYELPDITVHAEKLGRYMCYLPGGLDSNLGVMVRCACGESSSGANEMVLRPALPSNKAVYLHRLRLPERSESFADVPALAFLINGDVVVLNSACKFVKIFNRKGLLRYEFGDDDDLSQPSDLTITRDGEIAVADCGLLKVKVFDLIGTEKFSFGDDDLFQMPIAVTMDFIGRFLVCDQMKRRVSIHRQHGELLQIIDLNEVVTPQHIYNYGNKIYLCDSVNGVVAIYAYCKDGLQYLAKMSTGCDSGTAEFLDCSGICVDRYGNLYVSDMVLGRIHAINGKGEIGTVKPSGRAFLRPVCLATSTEGLLAVAQQGSTMSCDAISSQQRTIFDQEIRSNEQEQEQDDMSSLVSMSATSGMEVVVYRLLKADI